MNLLKTKVKLSNIKYFLLSFLVFFPNFISGYSSIYSKFLIIQSILCLFLLLNSFRYYRKIDSYLLLIIMFYSIQLLSTFLNNKIYFGTALREVFGSLSMILIFRESFLNRNYDLFRCLTLLFKMYILINFIQITLFPNLFASDVVSADHKLYFLGIENQMAQQLIPMTSIVIIANYLKYKRKTLSSVVYLIIAFTSEYLVGSSTGILASLSLLLGYLIINKLSESFLNLRVINIGYIIGSLLLMFSNLLIRIPAITYLIVKLLKRDLTFSNRSSIWEITFNNFLKSPWIGFGRRFEKSSMTFYAINQYDTNSNYSAHNVFLQTLFESGVVSLVPIFILVLITASKKQPVDHKVTKYICLGIASILITYLTESYDLMFCFILIGFIYYQSSLVKIYNHRYIKKNNLN